MQKRLEMAYKQTIHQRSKHWQM